MDLRPWAEQIDEMVTAGQYANALDLLEILDQVLLPDKVIWRSAPHTIGSRQYVSGAKADTNQGSECGFTVSGQEI